MAGHTLSVCLSVFFTFFMALLALRKLVLTLQTKVGFIVIEGINIQFYNIFLAAFMLRVAILTLLFFIDFTVITSFPGNIGRDLFVALSTQVILGDLTKYFMAVTALLLVFLMPLNDRARHHQ